MSSTEPIDFLAEESTIDPTSPFPSLLEMKLVETTVESGRKALKSSIEAISASANNNISNNNSNSLRNKFSVLLSHAFRKYQSEILLLFTYLIERKCLFSNSNSSLSESLYGLKRSSITNKGEIVPLTKSDKVRAALFLAVGPYVKEKIDRYYEKIIRDKRISDSRTRTSSNTSHIVQFDIQNNSYRYDREGNGKKNYFHKIQSIFMYIYPFLHMTHEGIHVAYNFAFLIGKSMYYNPSLRILRQVVRRTTLADMNTNNKITTTTKSTNLGAGSKNIAQSKTTINNQLTTSAGAVLSVALLAGWIGQLKHEIRRRRRRQFVIEDSIMYRNSNNTTTTTTTAGGTNVVSSTHNDITQGNVNDSDVLVIPPPLQPIANNSHLSDRFMCPLCKQDRVNPVASTSGYVFCYRCIVMHIREHGQRCPVTGIYCNESQLTRIYESTQILSR
mmetsp:Transcript_8960/g.10388  ORF Transcript_8960/g.10388 Transcript_8960/m.10388 type:complete len:445 (+) Transcript_8960:177-1511(+)